MANWTPEQIDKELKESDLVASNDLGISATARLLMRSICPLVHWYTEKKHHA